MTAAHTAFDFGLIVPEVDSEIVNEYEEPEPEQESYDVPDASFVKAQPRSNIAKSYEKKVRRTFSDVSRYLVQNENTAPDGAAIILYGPDVAEKLGNLAAEDPRIRRAIDFVTDGTENPYASLIFATAPLFLQVIRNHEPILEPAQRGFKVPFLKDSDGNPRRLRFRFGIKLGRLRNVTHEPKEFASYVLNHPDIRTSFEKQGVHVATPNAKPNGRSRKAS